MTAIVKGKKPLLNDVRRKFPIYTLQGVNNGLEGLRETTQHNVCEDVVIERSSNVGQSLMNGKDVSEICLNRLETL